MFNGMLFENVIHSLFIQTIYMKYTLPVLLVFISVMLSSCEAIEGIFKAGMWVGILASAAVVGLIIYLIAKVGRKK
jgi:hypothetical protein